MSLLKTNIAQTHEALPLVPNDDVMKYEKKQSMLRWMDAAGIRERLMIVLKHKTYQPFAHEKCTNALNTNTSTRTESKRTTNGIKI